MSGSESIQDDHSSADQGGTAVDLDFRLLFESLPGSYVAVLPDRPAFTVIAASDAYLRDAHRSRHEVIGRSIFAVFSDPSDPIRTATLRLLLSSLELVIAARQEDTMLVQRYFWPGPETQSGDTEEGYWLPVNSPILGPDGAVKFIIHRVENVTGYSRSRLTAAEPQFALAFLEAPIGMVLATPDGRVIEINEAMLGMLGYRREELIGRNSQSVTHPDDYAATCGFLASLNADPKSTGTIEKRYIRKDGLIFWARLSATLHRDPDGKPIRLVAMVEDVTERKTADLRLRAISDGTYEFMGLISPDGTLLEANRASLEFGNCARESVLGLPFWETPWFASIPEAKESVKQAIARAAAGEFVRQQATIYNASGEPSTFDVSLHPVRNDHGEVVLIVPEGREITALKALEHRNAFLVRLDDATRFLTDPQEITATVSRLLLEHLHADRCAYAELEEDENHFRVTGDYNQVAEPVRDRFAMSMFGNYLGDSLRAGNTFVLRNSETDERVGPLLDFYRSLGLAAFICVPLRKSGRLIATFAAHNSTPRNWSRDDIELVQMVASRVWETIERIHLSLHLAEREQHFRFLAESIPQMLWIGMPDGSLSYLSAQGLNYLGVEQDELLGAGWLAWVHEEDRQLAVDKWLISINTGAVYETSYRLRRHDGVWRWHLVRGVPVYQDDLLQRWYGTCTDIEDQKQAEAELHRQWQTFDTALSYSPDFTFIFDLQGRFNYANRATLNLLQKSYEEVVGKSFAELSYPDDLAKSLQRQIAQVIETRQPLRDQATFTSPNGNLGQYEHIFVPVVDANGRVRAVTGSSRDITQQKLAEELIRQDRQRWRELLLGAPAAIAVLRGPEHFFEFVNSDCIRLVGRPANQLLGRPAADALPEIVPQGFLEMLNQVYRAGQPRIEHEALIWLGEAGTLKEFHVSFACLPTRNAEGEIDGTFVHATDVTDLVRARKRIEESERQFRTLAETIPHLAWMAHAAGDIFWYNRRWYDFTGTTPEAMEGWGWQSIHDPEVLPFVLERWKNAIDTGEPFDMTFPLRAANGRFRSFLTRVEPVKDNLGNVVRWFGTNTDITDQKRTEEQLRRMNRDLEEFSYVASHDLQEPLRMVNIYAELLVRSIANADEKVDDYAKFIRQGVTRMEMLIRDLLLFSRSVHNDELPAGVANLTESLNESLTVLKNTIDETGAAISAPASFPNVCGDTMQLSHVFQNLLSNALKYCEKTTTPIIQISFEVDSSFCTITVRDNGIGFEQKYAESIFGLFRRLHKEDYPGTGLGLAICKRIVERYGGRMWAESMPNAGATFRFNLPLC